MAFSNILVPFDGSSFSVKAFNAALKIAIMHDAKIKIITCLEKENLGAWYIDKRTNKKIINDARIFAKKSLSNLEKIAKNSNISLSIHIVETKSISKQIVDFAKSRKIDLIVIGSHGQSKVKRIFLGSVSNSVSQTSKCPVLIIK
ncbi:universal stress protein [Nitrosopumilus sp. K4]|uniref:universal stress protein n=1 Tax=Nitrosopumilus sp. K4 TaxID=2795383 RepID=UPI001BA5BECC|nr:universal stress protein [Nitrosopumilus sp. K4]QUC65494.1 universal stress protein [Nitrosopumilus sp. K4]